MIRKNYDHHLSELQDDVLVMGSIVEKAIERSMESLRERDLKLANQVIAEDCQINDKRFAIEEKCISLIATQQPVADDLRFIVAVLNIITDLERIGDHARGISSIALLIGEDPHVKPLIDLPRMARKTCDMLRRSLDAFLHNDDDLAREICEQDDEVDALYDQVFRELLSFMAEDPQTITKATRLIWVAHNLERAADRITNICERVVFVVTGKMEEIKASYY